MLVEEWLGDGETGQRDESPRFQSGDRVGFVDDEVDDFDGDDLGKGEGAKSHSGRRRERVEVGR